MTYQSKTNYFTTSKENGNFEFLRSTFKIIKKRFKISKVPVLQVSSVAAQQTVTSSKSTIGTLEKGLKYIQC